MNPLDLGRFALAMTGDSQTCTMPNLAAPSDPNRIIADPDRAPALFNAIIEDSAVPKRPAPPRAGHRLIGGPPGPLLAAERCVECGARNPPHPPLDGERCAALEPESTPAYARDISR